MPEIETDLGPSLREELAARGISETTADRFGLYTAQYADGRIIADQAASAIAFPFTRQGKVIGINLRLPTEPDGSKKFLWAAKSEMALWNEDAIRDAADAGKDLIITEGIWDALTAIDAGFACAVSVPNGAPAETAAEEPLDAEHEKQGRFKCLYAARDQLRRVKRFIIATDSDGPGQKLAAELVRRLSPARCSFVTYPEDCKDLSDVRQWYDQARVVEVLNNARPYPVHGLYRLSEYPPAGEIEAFTAGWSTLDQHFKIIAGEFIAVTGIPSHGKSTFMHNVIVNTGLLHDWRWAIFSPENPAPTLRNRLRSMVSHKPVQAMRDDELGRVDYWIDEHILFIDGEPVRRLAEDESDFSLEWLLERAGDAVLRDGIKGLLIDPWNEVEHARERHESVTDYIGRAIRMIRRFARDYGVACAVVAHPTKDVFEKGRVRMPTLYDIEGSAHWFNKCDHGIVVWRPHVPGEPTKIQIAKSKFPEAAGEPGHVSMEYHRDIYRFTELQAQLPLA